MNMKSISITLLLFGATAGSASSVSKDVHPIVNVISKLQNLKAETVAEGQQEAALFEKFQLWCSDSTTTLDDAIADEKEKIAELEDESAGLHKQRDSLNAELSSLKDQIKDLAASMDEATNERNSTAVSYTTNAKKRVATINAVEKCRDSVEKAGRITEGGASQKSAASLAQSHVDTVLSLAGSRVTDEQRITLESFQPKKGKGEAKEATTIDPKSLQNLGKTPSKTLAKCQGDCDADSDCGSGLKCFHRSSSKALVPGCDAGGKGDVPTHDYCYEPSGELELQYLGKSGCKGSAKCGECQGDCDNDNDCSNGLKCFQREKGENVPGCAGTAHKDNSDYCYRAPEAKEEPKQRPNLTADGDMGAHVDVYDFKSEKVIELLKDLALKFQDENLAKTQEETASINAHKGAQNARKGADAAARKSKQKKDVILGGVEAGINATTKNLGKLNEDLRDDSKAWKDTKQTCRIKTSEWEQRSQTRKFEAEAMEQAVQILSKATGVRTEAPGNPIPPPSPEAAESFLQVSDVRASVNDPKLKAVALLKEAAKNAHSRALERLAVEVAAHLDGPFDQVNNMIEKMIYRLMDEQKQEDEHKHWCDQELKRTDTMKNDKADKVDDLTKSIDVEDAELAELSTELTNTQTMISKIEAFMQESTEIRQTGKRENALAIKDAANAQNALADAIAVLTDFYKSSGGIAKEPWEFLQSPENLPKGKPQLWGSSYTMAADEDNQPGGIISVLEGVMDNFSKMEAATKSQEAQDQAEYEEAMKDSKIEKAGRVREASMMTAEKARRVNNAASLSRNRKDTDVELSKAKQYLDQLRPACGEKDEVDGYESRRKSRSAEIDALKSAKGTLKEAFSEKAKFLQINRHM